jgi:hypothetical protein
MYGLHLGKEDLKVYALLILFGERDQQTGRGRKRRFDKRARKGQLVGTGIQERSYVLFIKAPRVNDIWSECYDPMGKDDIDIVKS